MRPSKDPPKRRTARPASPPGSRRPATAPSATFLDRELATEPDTISLFEDLQISEEYTNSNTEPRSFSYSVKQQCWDKAEKVKGRDPHRWRRDPLGNIVFRKLLGCPGCLCHDYDHIVPYSKVMVLHKEFLVFHLLLSCFSLSLLSCADSLNWV
uniref:Uncharacterized protein n=1 Tax=Rhizophora mucronata TaxID=61149 RepID=A0A2P2MQY3_RHIMU